MKDIIFINTHPIQYFAPMYRYMNEQGIKTKAWYCSDFAVKGGFDKQFGVDVKWDIPLLEGYEYKFFKNYSWKPSHFNGFFGLINLGLIRELFKIQPSVIVVHGWNFCTHFFVLMLGKLKGHTVCIRNDMPYKHELYKKGWKQKIKKTGLGNFLFPRISKFLYIGTQNKLFYESYGIKENRLLFCPYAVDNQRFLTVAKGLLPAKEALRQKHNIPARAAIILFAAKYITKKNPIDLLRAFKALNNPNTWLVMVGEGELRPLMEAFIKENNLKNVVLTGFINQAIIPEYYALADVFVMCSGLEENWGLSVNEAMNFNLPVIASDLTGCSEDLVMEGANGYVFKTGDTAALTQKLEEVLLKHSLSGKPSSKDIVAEFDYAIISKKYAGHFMKVLYIGAGGGTSMDRANALRRSGHEVSHIDLPKILNRFAFLSTWLSKTGSLFFGNIIKWVLISELKKVKTTPSDVAWVNNDHLLNKDALQQLKRVANNVLVYINDDPFGSRDGMKWRLLLGSLKLYDLVVVVRDVNIEEAYKRGAKKVIRVLMSADELTHAPMELSEAEKNKYASDVCFVGTGFPERGAFMKRLIELGVPLSIWGNSWDKLVEWETIKSAWRGNGVEGRDCIKALTGAKICLGLVSKENRDLSTTRSAEIPYSKNLFCAVETTEHLAMYEKDKEAVFWTTPEDCAQKCLALLQQPDKIEEIKEAGHARAIKSGYLNQAVVDQILNSLT